MSNSNELQNARHGQERSGDRSSQDPQVRVDRFEYQIEEAKAQLAHYQRNSPLRMQRKSQAISNVERTDEAYHEYTAGH